MRFVERVIVDRETLDAALPPETDDSYHCLTYIDTIEVTQFNEPQVSRLVAELGRRQADAPPVHAVVLGELGALAQRAEREHLRLVIDDA